MACKKKKKKNPKLWQENLLVHGIRHLGFADQNRSNFAQKTGNENDLKTCDSLLDAITVPRRTFKASLSFNLMPHAEFFFFGQVENTKKDKNNPPGSIIKKF